MLWKTFALFAKTSHNAAIKKEVTAEFDPAFSYVKVCF